MKDLSVIFILVAAIVALASWTLVLRSQEMGLQTRITRLERACIPTNTGGGVWQCVQPDAIEAPPTP